MTITHRVEAQEKSGRQYIVGDCNGLSQVRDVVRELKRLCPSTRLWVFDCADKSLIEVPR